MVSIKRPGLDIWKKPVLNNQYYLSNSRSLERPGLIIETLEYKLHTLKSLIEEHARLDFSDFLSTLLAIFHVINEKFHPARLLIYLVNKLAGWQFFPSLLVYSGLLVYLGLQSRKVSILIYYVRFRLGFFASTPYQKKNFENKFSKKISNKN